MPSDTSGPSSVGFVATGDGTTKTLYLSSSKAPERTAADASKPETGGVIHHGAMPSLLSLLEAQSVAYTILDRPQLETGVPRVVERHLWYIVSLLCATCGIVTGLSFGIHDFAIHPATTIFSLLACGVLAAVVRQLGKTGLRPRRDYYGG